MWYHFHIVIKYQYGTFRKHIANTGFADYSLRMFCLAEGRKAHWALLTGLLWVSGPDSCPAATGFAATTDCAAAESSPAAAGSSAAAAVDLAGREEKLNPGGQLMLLARQSKSLVQGGASEYSSTVLWIRTRIQENKRKNVNISFFERLDVPSEIQKAFPTVKIYYN